MASKKKDTVSGEEAFELYYSQQYGTRWSSLKDALKKDTVYFSVDFSSDECSLEKYFLDPGSICSALCLPVKNAEKLLDLCAAPGGKTLILSGTREKESVLYSNERSPQRKERLVKVVKDSLPPSLSDSTKISCSDGAVWCRRETESFDSILLDVSITSLCASFESETPAA